jgi:hypothetical protein
LTAIVAEHRPIGIRGTFYRAEVLGLLPKTEEAAEKVQRRLLQLRRAGIIPYSWIVDESRAVYGHNTYNSIADLADDVAGLYRRDYWRTSPVWVQVWVEKRTLIGVLSPVVTDRWGLNLYVGGGQPSETYLYRAGEDIKNRGVKTYIYILADFDPAGDTIYKTLAYGTKRAPGGLKRFTGGVPIHIHRLALTAEQVKKWRLPTRPAKESDKRTKKFVEEHGNISVELEALSPNHLRDLVDRAISRHMPSRVLDSLKAVEAHERGLARAALEAVGGDDEEEDDH